MVEVGLTTERTAMPASSPERIIILTYNQLEYTGTFGFQI